MFSSRVGEVGVPCHLGRRRSLVLEHADPQTSFKCLLGREELRISWAIHQIIPSPTSKSNKIWTDGWKVFGFRSHGYTFSLCIEQPRCFMKSCKLNSLTSSQTLKPQAADHHDLICIWPTVLQKWRWIIWNLGLGSHIRRLFVPWCKKRFGYSHFMARLACQHATASSLILLPECQPDLHFYGRIWRVEPPWELRKGLRVTQPHGYQRSSYFLQLPYRWSLPLIVISGTLHWLLSRVFS